MPPQRLCLPGRGDDPHRHTGTATGDFHQQSPTTSLQTVQRRSARRIFRGFRPTNSASAALVSELNLQPPEDRRTMNEATFVYKIVCGLVDFTQADWDTDSSPFQNEYPPCTHPFFFLRRSDCGTVFHRRHPLLTPLQPPSKMLWKAG